MVEKNSSNRSDHLRRFKSDIPTALLVSTENVFIPKLLIVPAFLNENTFVTPIHVVRFPSLKYSKLD